MKKIIASIMFFFALLGNSWAEKLELTLPNYGDSIAYFHELLKTSLEADGHTVKMNILSADIVTNRIMQMLERDEGVTLHWRGQTPERDKKFTRVNFPLTNGLKGKRIFFIPKGKQSEYNNVKTLKDFKKLNKVCGFGKGWTDVEVWKANGLPYIEIDGAWDPNIYIMLASGNRGIDYFSRGSVEIAGEAKSHPELDIEQRLLFVYDNDFVFYLSKSNARLKPIIEKALKKAKASGLLDKLLRKHYPDVFNKLNLQNRTVIKLIMPEIN